MRFVSLKKSMIFLLPYVFVMFGLSHAKNYKGAELRTKESFLYGRFEVRMKPPVGQGLLASFFTYHDTPNSAEWNEIDVEILGRYRNNVQVTSIGPYQTIRPSHQWVPFNTHKDYHTYAFEWTPDYIAWFVDGKEVHRQSDDFVRDFHYPQKIMMNIWNPVWETWAGPWNDAVLPAFAFYDYVSYASYTPHAGNCGTDNNFTLQWRDDFDSLNTARWQKATHTFDGNNCDFTPENVVFRDGKMILCLTDNTHLGFTDLTPPTMLYAWMLDSTVFVRFNEMLDSVSANTAANFRIPGLEIKSARWENDERTVRLQTTSPDSTKTYNLVVLNVKDRAQPPNTQIGQVLTIRRLQWPQLPFFINVGGEAFGAFHADQEWRPDRLYGYLDGQSQTFYDHPHIANSPNDTLFWTERHDVAAYRIRLPQGLYRLRIWLAESKEQQAGQRLFSIIAEGKTLLQNLDPFAQAGYRQAVLVQGDSLRVQDGTLDIYFVNHKSVSLINAIEVDALSTGLSKTHEKIIPHSLELLPAFPNPFNGQVSVPFKLHAGGDVRANIYDIRGCLLHSIRWKNLAAGRHVFRWNGLQNSSGIYFLVVQYGNGQNEEQRTQKIVLIK